MNRWIVAGALLLCAVPLRAQEPAAMPPAPAAELGTDPRDAELERLRKLVEELARRVAELEKARPAPAAPAPEHGGHHEHEHGQERRDLLPKVHVTGNLQFRAGDSERFRRRGRIHLAELEIAFHDAVTRNLRYDVFLSAAHEEEFEVALEEAFITAPALAPGLGARAGRIRVPFGKHNPLHPHRWVFVTQPSAVEALLGPEGLTSDGGVLEYRFPGRRAGVELGHWATASESEGRRGFSAGRSGALSGRLWVLRDVGGGGELEAGFSRYQGRGEVAGHGRHLSAVSGIDLTYRSHPERDRGLLVALEALLHETYGIRGGTRGRPGGFLTVAYRWHRDWEAGGRADHTRFPFPARGHESALSLFLTRYFTEQTSLRLQYTYARTGGIGTGHGLFLQLLFGSGAHRHGHTPEEHSHD